MSLSKAKHYDREVEEMTNGEKFRKIFKEFATEVWAFSEKDFLTWLNTEYEESTIRNCFGCKYSKDNHIAGTEVCHLCMWENQYTPTTKNDLALIHTEGLDEEIRCTMCTNYMKSDRGCDGSCVVDKNMYKAVIDAIEKRIQPTTKNDLGVLDKIRAEIVDSGAYEQEVNGKTEFLEGINYCLSVIDKYKAESEST